MLNNQCLAIEVIDVGESAFDPVLGITQSARDEAFQTFGCSSSFGDVHRLLLFVFEDIFIDGLTCLDLRPAGGIEDWAPESVVPKMTEAPLKATTRDSLSSRLASTISTPLEANVVALALEAERVMPRTL